MFFMHSCAQVSPCSRLRESLSYFFQIFKELLEALSAKANIQAAGLGYGFLILARRAAPLPRGVAHNLGGG